MRAAYENAPTGEGRGAESNEAGSFGSDPTPIAVDLREAQRFLTVLDPDAKSWHFRTFPDTGSGGGKNHTGTLSDAATDLQLDNGNGRGVFVVVNDGGGKDADIARVRAVFADFDGTPMPDRFDFDPHLIIESSASKFHVYWLVDGLEVDAFKPTQQAIAARYGSDPSVCNPSRVMRLPGFVHRKGEPFQTRIIHESGALPYAAGDVLAAFPQASKETPRSEHATGTGERVVSEERHGDLLKLAARFARQVHFDGLGSDAALAALFAEAARGRWTREVPADEIRRAFDGALDKCRRGEWKQADQPGVDDPDDEPPEPRLIEVAVGNLMSAKVVAPRFVAAPIIPRGVATLLGGHGGGGKTNGALLMVAHTACGRPWAGFEFEQCKGVFISLEDSGDKVRFTLRRIVETYRLDPELVAANVRIFDGTQGDAALMTELNDHGNRTLVPTPLMVEMEAACAGAGLIVVDNASDGFDGNENDRRQVRGFMRRLAGIAKANDAGLVLLAHIDKHAARSGGSGNNYSGSTAWHNSARSRLALVDEEGAIELRHEKCNLAKKADPVRLAWNDLGVLIPVAVDTASANASADLIASADADHVFQVVRVAVESGEIITTSTAGPHTTVHALEALPELGKVYRDKSGRKRVRAAIVRLAREGRIVRATYTTPSRNVRECWQPSELTQPAPASGEKSATNLRWLDTPIPPCATNAQSGDCVSSVDAPTNATNATNADECQRCDGEGCRHCVEAAL
jgi:hypothetical protein